MSAAALGAVYQLGLLLLMFAAGAEMRRLLQRNAVRTVGLIAGFGMVLPFAAGLGLVAALGSKEFLGPARNDTALVLVFGLAIAVTSIPVISRIMHDLNLLSTRFARIVLSVAVTEDIVLYVVLAVAVGLVQTTSSAFGIPAALNLHTIAQNSAYHTVIAVIFLSVALRCGGRAYKMLAGMRANVLARRSPVAFQLLWMLALSAAALALGVVPLYRAFTAGLAVAVADDNLAVRQDRNALTGISFGFFIPVYFALIGVQLDLLHHFNPLFFLGFTAHQAGSNLGTLQLAVRVLTGAAPSQAGAASGTFDATTFPTSETHALTNTQPGSWLYVAVGNGDSSAALTPVGSEANVNVWNDPTSGSDGAIGRLATSGTGSQTLGWTASAGDPFEWAAQEVLHC
jgi:Kef-type K+ transport system membrane component KefB